MQSNDMELGSCLELPKLKRIKNYLRSIMTEDSMKLHHPALDYCHINGYGSIRFRFHFSAPESYFVPIDADN